MNHQSVTVTAIKPDVSLFAFVNLYFNGNNENDVVVVAVSLGLSLESFLSHFIVALSLEHNNSIKIILILLFI